MILDNNGPIYEENTDFIFTDAKEMRVPIVDIHLDPQYKIDVLTDIEGNEVDPETVQYQKYALKVPGLGNILPGSRVIWKEEDYVLQFGWHTNVSNQEIFTWYLLPLESIDTTPKTLYRWMIKEIELVHFR